jgi:hypothetical protein
MRHTWCREGANLPENDREGVQPVEDDQEAVFTLAHDMLRENLHRAVQDVVTERFRDQRVRDALFAELTVRIDAAVDDHIAAERLGQSMPPATLSEGSPPAESSGSVRHAIEMLRAKVQATFGPDRPGIRQATTAAMKIVPSVVESLRTVVHDEVAFGRVKRAAELLLSRYMNPAIARQIVNFAAAAARRAARPPPEGDAGT